MPFGAFGEASASIALITPPPAQSTQTLPCVEPKPSTGWLNMLYASKRNCALYFSVMLKFFDSDMSEKNARGPRNQFLPALPMCPQAGSANGPEVGRANVKASVAAGTAPYASGATGVNQVSLPLESRCRPVSNDRPGSRSGRQTISPLPVCTSEMWP